jgi:hypothetical protein
MEWRYLTAICGNPLNRIDTTGCNRRTCTTTVKDKPTLIGKNFLEGSLGKKKNIQASAYPGVSSANQYEN